jgi:long-chain fatty acid transport protein
MANMDQRSKLKLLAIIISGVSALNASANGFRLADQDAFATARGEAFVATADNASAIYYNPAGITQLEGNNLRSGIYGIYLDPSYHALGSSATYNSSDNLAAVPQLFYTCTPKDFPLSFGLGVYAPYGGSMNWPDDSGFRTIATQGKLTYLTLNPVVAVKLLPSLSFGAGVMVNYVNMDLEQGLRPFAQPLANFFEFKGDGWSVAYNLGLRWQPIDQISIGATFRSTASVILNGHTDFEQQPLVQTTSLPAHMDFRFPLTVVCGLSYRPTPRWNMEFDADFTDWRSFGKTTIYQLGSAPLGGPQNPPVTLDWQASWMYEFGVTRYFDKGWHASAGYVFNGNSVPNSYYTPLAADLDRHFFSIGAGHAGRRFDFDVAYQFGYGPASTVTGSTASSTPGRSNNQTADGTYHFISDAVFVTVGLHF